ncbi:putative F-box associated domain, type 3 [Helianthus debilis subsp. tardiflorus]
MTHVLTIDDHVYYNREKADHLNGIVLFTCMEWFSSYRHTDALVLNPSTRKFFKLPDPYTDRKGYSYNYNCNVCVNSVIHLMPENSFDILAFDLRTDKFSIISTPLGDDDLTNDSVKENYRRLIKTNGCIGLVCLDRVTENNKMNIWILQDYENRVWFKEIIIFP